MEEKNTLRLLTLTRRLFSVLMAQWYEAALFTIEEVGVHVQIPAGQLAVLFFVLFFLSSCFYPLACFHFYSNC